MAKAYGFDEDSVARIRASVRKTEGDAGPPGHRALSLAPPRLVERWNRITSTTMDGDRYPGKWLLPDVTVNPTTYSDGGNAWLKVPNGETLALDTRYLGQLDGVHTDGLPIYLVTAAAASGFSGASVSTITIQTIPNATGTLLSFGIEQFDTDDFFTAGTPTRLTIPADGYYLVGALAQFAGVATGTANITVKKNGSVIVTEMAANCDRNIAGTHYGPAFAPSRPTFASEGDYLELQAYQDSGSSLNVFSGAGLWAFKI